MADLQKENSDLKHHLKNCTSNYLLLSDLYGRLLQLVGEEPCTHGPDLNCWHKSRAGVMNNFPKKVKPLV